MRYPYAMPLTPPFHGYFQTPMRPMVPNSPYISSQASKSSSSGELGIDRVHFFYSKLCILQTYAIQFNM